MPDVWSTVAELEPPLQEHLASVLETRGADQQQQAMRRALLCSIESPAYRLCEPDRAQAAACLFRLTPTHRRRPLEQHQAKAAPPKR